MLGYSPDAGPGSLPVAKRTGQVNEAEVRRQLARLDRSPIQQCLAVLIKLFLEHKGLRDWADERPDQLIRSISLMLKGAGFADRHETVAIPVDMVGAIREYAARHGTTAALEVLEHHSLPVTLLGVTLDAKSEASASE